MNDTVKTYQCDECEKQFTTEQEAFQCCAVADCGCVDKMATHICAANDSNYLPFFTDLKTGNKKFIIKADIYQKKRKSPGIVPVYCPFCGVKY